MAFSQLGQCEAGQTTEAPVGTRSTTTFKKLPTTRPSKIVQATIMRHTPTHGPYPGPPPTPRSRHNRPDALVGKGATERAAGHYGLGLRHPAKPAHRDNAPLPGLSPRAGPRARPPSDGLVISRRTLPVRSTAGRLLRKLYTAGEDVGDRCRGTGMNNDPRAISQELGVRFARADHPHLVAWTRRPQELPHDLALGSVLVLDGDQDAWARGLRASDLRTTIAHARPVSARVPVGCGCPLR